MTISVIVPVFNRELTIARCLQSIINQIVAVDEVIVVDDGSVDGTAEIIKSYQLDHPNIKLVEKRNGGVASARNAGIRVATGEWILFLDSDDVWVPKKIQNFVQSVQKFPQVEFWHTNRAQQLHGVIDGGRTVPASSMQDKEFLYSNWAIKTSTVAVSRKLIESVGKAFDESLRTCEDYEFFWRCIFAANKVGYIDLNDTIIYLGDDGISRSTRRELCIRDNLEAMQRFKDWVGKKSPERRKVGSLMRARMRREYSDLWALSLPTGGIRRAHAALSVARRDIGTFGVVASLLSAVRARQREAASTASKAA